MKIQNSKFKIQNSKFKLLTLLLCSTLFVLMSCEKDLYENSIQNDSRDIIVKSISIDDVQSNQEALKKLTDPKSRFRTNANSSNKALNDTINNFTIDIDNGLYIEVGNYNSYTFKINRPNGSEYLLENIIVSKKNETEYETFINQYIITEQELELIENREFVDLTGKINRIALESAALNDHLASKYYFNGSCYEDDFVYVGGNVCEAGFHDFSYIMANMGSESQCEFFLNGTYTATTGAWIIKAVLVPCDNPGGGDGPGGDTSGGHPGSGGSGSTYTGAVGSNPLESYVKNVLKNITNPNAPNYSATRAACYNQTSPEFKGKLATLLTTNYLELAENGEVTTSSTGENIVEQFANAAIDAKCNGGDVDFDNGVILDPSFLLNAKAICVYNKLKSSSTFKDIFANVFDATKKPFIILKTNNLLGNADGGAVGTCVPTNGNHLLNTIEIDTDLIADGHPLQIAKTIAHEFIHAFLNIKLFNAGLGMSIPAISNLDFIQAVNTYYNGFSDGQDQHNFMYNFMIPTLQSILAEIKDLCVTPQNNIDMLDLSVSIPYNTSPTTPFIWNDYFMNLALAGLQDCSFFQLEIGTFDTLGQPIAVDQTKMQSYNIYNKRGKDNLL